MRCHSVGRSRGCIRGSCGFRGNTLMWTVALVLTTATGMPLNIASVAQGFTSPPSDFTKFRTPALRWHGRHGGVQEKVTFSMSSTVGHLHIWHLHDMICTVLFSGFTVWRWTKPQILLTTILYLQRSWQDRCKNPNQWVSMTNTVITEPQGNHQLGYLHSVYRDMLTCHHPAIAAGAFCWVLVS